MKNNIITSGNIFYKFPLISTFISTRLFGSSEGKFSSFNLSYMVGDKLQNVSNNRHTLIESLCIKKNEIFYLNCVHGNNVKCITDSNIETNELHGYDGLITNLKGIYISILTADCIPLLLFDPVKQVIGVLHIGWRGIENDIIKIGLNTFQNRYGCSIEDIIAFLGPSIKKCCYYLKDESAVKFFKSLPNQSKYLSERDDKIYIDLQSITFDCLLDIGLRKKNIDIDTNCTMCNNDTFYSYRYSNKQTGRFCTGIMMKSLS